MTWSVSCMVNRALGESSVEHVRALVEAAQVVPEKVEPKKKAAVEEREAELSRMTAEIGDVQGVLDRIARVTIQDAGAKGGAAVPAQQGQERGEGRGGDA